MKAEALPILTLSVELPPLVPSACTVDNHTCTRRRVGLARIGRALCLNLFFADKSVGWNGEVLNSHTNWLCTLVYITNSLWAGFLIWWHPLRINQESRHRSLAQCLACSICMFFLSAELHSSTENRTSVQGPIFTMTKDWLETIS